ncbi:MAG TPA: pilus assembly protein N-terminal domain-containing protein [Candidatus Acidoferrales bacterium]|nr:pilus assembly protein N-terminal domain-containing protein [Candidatus Acidoferrales bacterium]
MTGRSVRFIAPLLFLVGFCTCFPIMAVADSDTIVLESGASTIVEAPGLTRVATGDSGIAGVVPIGTQEVIINAKGPGRTTVYVWSQDGNVTRYEVYVSGQLPNDLAQMVKAAIGIPDVQVVSIRNAVIVRGVAKDLGEAQYIDSVIARFSEFAKQEHQSIIDTVFVPHPLGELDDELQRMPGASGIRMDYDPKGTGDIIVSGRVHDRQEAEEVLAKARGLAGPFLASDAKVIDRLAVDVTSQIDVKVYVLEVDKTGMSDIGVEFNGYNPVTQELVNPSFPVVEDQQAGSPGKAFNIGAFFRTIFLAPTINLLLQTGHGRILSSPDLVTLPGSEAKFLVGGQIPYTYSSGLGTVSIQFQQYGVQLDVTPTILGNGKIECKIAPTISDLDYTNEVMLNGTAVPGLTTSQLSTDVITSEGEGVLMGGLLRHLQQKVITKIPGLSAIPILGQLFQSVNYTNNESDVVFVVTPVVINQ